MSLRRWLSAALLGYMLFDSSLADAEIPATGESVSQLVAFDDLMTSFMEEHQAVGASLAIYHKGKLVYARGFGYGDAETKEPVLPTSLVRIARISKPFNSVAILQLVERGTLTPRDLVSTHYSLHDADAAYSALGRGEIIGRAVIDIGGQR